MGIFGLTTYINRNSKQFLENHQLRDTLVVIDGYAATNFLYKRYENQTSAFGGDYDIMANVYVDFINMFLRCNVVPIFVFDGAYEERKMGTIMQRMSEKIRLYSRPIKENFCMPYFGSEIIFNILNDMDIPHLCCTYEADAEIVALAKLLDCPVISNDSDFFINTVPYIPLHMINIDLKSSKNKIDCRLYKVEKLLNVFGGLKTEYLPLVAALLGNDYIRPDTFAPLLRLNPDNFDCGLKLQRITDWLKTQKNVSSAVYYMTRNLPHSKGYIIHQIKTIIKDYKIVNSNYLSFVLHYKRMNIYQDRVQSHLKTSEKVILPCWLEYNYRKGVMNSGVMIMLTLKKWFFKVCIENYDRPPYYEVSFKILERIFGLLIGKKDLIPCVGRRNGLTIGQFYIKPFISNPYVPLANLNKTSLEYRKNIILNLVGIKNLYGIPKEWELFILVLMYWAIQTNNRNSSHMHALIVNAITFNIIKKSLNIKQNETMVVTGKFKIEKNIVNVKREDCLNASNVLSKYFELDQYDDKNLYHNIIHPFAQFQSCVDFFLILNSLLDSPYEPFRIVNFFKGSFLYNLCVKIESNNPEVFVTKHLFYKLDSLNKVYSSIINRLNSLPCVPQNKITTGGAKPQKKGKKTSKNHK